MPVRLWNQALWGKRLGFSHGLNCSSENNQTLLTTRNSQIYIQPRKKSQEGNTTQNSQTQTGTTKLQHMQGLLLKQENTNDMTTILLSEMIL